MPGIPRVQVPRPVDPNGVGILLILVIDANVIGKQEPCAGGLFIVKRTILDLFGQWHNGDVVDLPRAVQIIGPRDAERPFGEGLMNRCTKEHQVFPLMPDDMTGTCRGGVKRIGLGREGNWLILFLPRPGRVVTGRHKSISHHQSSYYSVRLAHNRASLASDGAQENIQPVGDTGFEPVTSAV